MANGLLPIQTDAQPLPLETASMAAPTTLPTGAGTTKPSALPVGGGAPAWAYALAGMADVASHLATGKQGNQLLSLMQLQQGQLAAKREERQTKTAEEDLALKNKRFALDQVKEARTIQTQQMQESRAFVTQASDLAGKILAIPEGEQRTAAVNAMVDEARTRGGERTATIVSGILQTPDVGKLIGPKLRYIPETMAPALMQEGALLFHAGKVTEVDAKSDVIALPGVVDALFSRMRAVKGAVGDQFKDKPIPLSILDAAITAANPNDAPGTNPELNLRLGVGDVYAKAHPKISDALGSMGFEVPGVAAEAAKAAATAKASAQATKDVALDPKNLAKDIAAHVEKIRQEAPAKREAAVKQAEALIPVKVAEKGALDRADAGAGLKPPTLGDLSAFTAQFEQQSKTFKDVRDAYGGIVAAKAPADEKLQGPADIALLVGYMKMIDPGSTVRENEFATAENAGGVAENIRNTYNKLVGGSKLTPELRTSFKTQARELFSAHRETHLARESEYKRLAKARNIDPDAVIPDLVGKYRPKGEGAPTPDAPKPATQRDIDKALLDAGGNKAKARELLLKRGFSGNSPVR